MLIRVVGECALVDEFVSWRYFDEWFGGEIDRGWSVMVAALGGCTSSYYKTMKTFGKEKRDILVSRVKDSKKDQQQAKEQIKTTMESFQALTGFQGGPLEKNYKKLNGEYEKAADCAQKLHNRIDSIDQVSKDLFKEWQKEIDGMENKKLKAQSAVMLRQSRLNEANYVKSMRQTEARMTPVITAFHDQVTFSEAQFECAGDWVAEGDVGEDVDRCGCADGEPGCGRWRRLIR